MEEQDGGICARKSVEEKDIDMCKRGRDGIIGCHSSWLASQVWLNLALQCGD